MSNDILMRLPKNKIEKTRRENIKMKKKIHPKYNTVEVICSCGNKFETGSTLNGTIKIEICSSCHPFFTGKQKLIDTAGRVDRFNKRYGSKK